MTEPINDLPRPELCHYCDTCKACVNRDHRSQCESDSVDCHEQRALWDSGYAAGVKRAGQEIIALGMDRDVIRHRADAAEAKLAELKSVNRYQRGYSDGQKEEREKAVALALDLAGEQQKLAELVRDVREWRAERFGPAILDAILDKHDKPEGG